MVINPAAWRVGRFACVECETNLLVWLDTISRVGFRVGDHTKNQCPSCNKATWWRVVEVKDIPRPSEPPIGWILGS